MFPVLVILLVVTPLVEISLLIRVADHVGGPITLLIVAATGFVGAFLARRQGLSVWMQIQADMAQGRMPASRLVDAMLIFVAGVLLITPGLLTDGVGFSLLVPPIRRWYKRKAADYFRGRLVVMHPDANASMDDGFIDVEVTEVTDDHGTRLP